MKSGLTFVAVAAVVLGACAPTVPAEQGVGFDEFSQFELDRARREAALRGQPTTIVPPPQVTGVPGAATGVSATDLARAGIGQAAPTAPATVPQTAGNLGSDPLRTQGIDASPTNAAPALVGVNSGGLSDEQNFDAVSGRETIESDAQRRAAQAAAREQVQPTAVPERPANTGPNIVQYALGAPNVKGQEWYSRSLLSGQGRFQRNCAKYLTADDAQRDFLARGGPERDRLGIDPDGDGFACGWDPAPFVQAIRN